MGELLTAEQMRAIEQNAIDSQEVTGLELMERAGRGVVDAIFEEWPELAVAPQGATPSGSSGHLQPENARVWRAVVLCGPGNNGGDGFVIARLLHERGWEVELFLYGAASKLPPDARVNYERWCALGAVRSVDDARVLQADLCIDALFGTGLTRPVYALENLLWTVYEAQANIFCGPNSPWIDRTVAVDIPSGICADSGRMLGWADDDQDWTIRADLTVTFHLEKLGHKMEDGPFFTDKLVVRDIGLRHRGRMSRRLVSEIECPQGELRKGSWGHKYSHGHALIVAGRSGKGGAARLAARAALRIGAGLVTVAPTPGALQENAARLDAVMLSPVGDAQSLQTVLEDERLNALCLGPGLGVERARDMVPVALAAQRPTVLDADALTAFRDDPSVLFDMLHDTCVLTPHAGEFARLFPDIAEKLNAPAIEGPAFSKVDATREAAARAGCVVLFKGADTVIATPDGRCSINAAAYERSAPWLATAGSGDVLAGFITGLLARGFAPEQAAKTAAWLHVECAIKFGPGLIAEDLPEVLPSVFKALLQVPSPS